MKPRRSIYEIVWEILSYCIEPRKLTHIIQTCNLNTSTAKKYLNLLVKKGLLKKRSEYYITTERGSDYINTFVKLYEKIFSE